ncbi:MAG TPA: alpha/beta fold hydrolase [Allosphingosinicella sp.]|nr:alpha/beta fold hydrolase [Allosphingosinicella sp.]
MGPLSAMLAAASLTAAPVSAEIDAPGPSGPLRGTLLTPAGAQGAPVVLIIPGSGAIDRNGNNSMAGIRAAPYRLLAESLAARGIATIRIDKRGILGSAGAGPANAATIADYAADIRQWARAARARTGARCVWLLGHSEGGLVALVAGQNPQDLCGLILVSAGGRPMGEVIREQIRASPQLSPVLDQALPAIAALEAGRRVDVTGMDARLLPLFAPPIQDIMISLLSYDPARLIATAREPVLIVQGQRDLHVGEADARRLAAANPAARLVLLPEVNHVLKTVATADRAANVATYADPGLPLAPGVTEAIADFVRAR